MKKLTLLLLLVATQILSAQEKAFVTASSPDGKYSINHLKGWTPTFGSGNILVSLKASTSNADNIPIQLALTKEDNVQTTLTTDDYATRNFIVIKNMIGANVVERGTATINGVTAQWVSYDYDIQERPMKGIAYFFIQNGSAYQLVIHSAEADFKSMEPAFKQIAESLVIK